MPLRQLYFSEQLIHALGWTVLHSLWQAALVALLVLLILRSFRGLSALYRYWIAFSGLIFTLLTSVVTFLQYYRSGSAVHVIVQSGTPSVSGPGAAPEVSLAAESFSWSAVSASLDAYLPLVVAAWLLGVLLFVLRTAGGMVYLNRLRRRQHHRVSAFWRRRMEAVCQGMGVRRPVQWVESEAVKVALVTGFFRPLIIFPIGAFNALDTAEVEAILAHELAHIKRHDYFFNIIQALIEALFHFNPGVWWLSAVIRTERENCCDDLALRHCGNALLYAKALVRLQEVAPAAPPAMAMAVTGGKKQLLQRVRRILEQPQKKVNFMEKFTATCLLLAAVLLFSISAAKPMEKEHKKEEHFISTLASHWTPSPALSGIPIRLVASQSSSPRLALTIQRDSLPKGKIRFKKMRDGEMVEARLEDGALKYLKIGEREIPEAALPEYETFVEEMLAGAPPAPPAPPTPPTPPAPPAAPSPPAPPAAPEPPAPPAPGSEVKTIRVEKDEEGGATLIIRSGGDEQTIIELSDEDDIRVNGERIAPGEELIIIEGAGGDSFHFAYPGARYFYRFGDGEFEWDEDVRFESPEEARRFYFDRHEELRRERSERSEEKKQRIREIEEEVKQRREEIRERHRAESDRIRGMAEQRREEAQTRIIVGERYPHASSANQLQKAIERQLLADGLIEDPENYKLELTGRQLKVDGKRQPIATWERYLALYEKTTGKPLGEKGAYVVNKKNRAQ